MNTRKSDGYAAHQSNTNRAQLVVYKIPKASLAYSNACFVNHSNKHYNMIKLMDTGIIYPLQTTVAEIAELPYGLYTSDVIRSSHNLILGSPANVEFTFGNGNNIYEKVNNIKLHIMKKHLHNEKYSKLTKDIIVNLHEKDIIDVIRLKLKDHYFSKGQICLITINNLAYTISVVSINGSGYLNNSTKISVETSDNEINLIGSKLLRRELFQDDFKFESIGIGGLSKELITIFREALCTRAYRPSIIEKLGIKQVKGILLHGPPGTGKTLIARNLSNIISPVKPIVIKGPELLNKFVGGSEENIRNLFSKAEEDYRLNGLDAMLHVIVFDEIDAICKARGSGGPGSNVTDSMVNQLLTKIDGYDELPNIFIIAMTNRKDLLDKALIRPGRIEKHIKIGLPDKTGREEIFRVHTNKMKLSGMLDANVDLSKCADLTENFNGSEIEAVVKCAASLTLHELLGNNNKNNNRNKRIENKNKEIQEEEINVTMDHMIRAINTVETDMNNSKRYITKHLPSNFKILSKSYNKALTSLNEFINYDNDYDSRLRTVLLYGDNKCGKSALASYLINEKQIKCVKIISAINLINKSDSAKSEYLADTMFDAHLSDQSLLVLDDIDIIINYAKFGYSITFSNSIFQTIKTILKSVPDANNKIIILCICNEHSLKLAIENLFDLIVTIDLETSYEKKRNGNIDNLNIDNLNFDNNDNDNDRDRVDDITNDII